MKTRRLVGVGAAGVAVVLLTAPIAASALSAPADPEPAEAVVAPEPVVALDEPEDAPVEPAVAPDDPAVATDEPAAAPDDPAVATVEEAAAAVDVPAPTTTATTAPPRPAAVCPVAGPVHFVDSFGDQRAGHRHEGVDMMAAEGTPAVAPVAGLVSHRSNRTGGLSYHLEGVDGSYYYGTHLSAYSTAGWVEAGEIIGFVGGTGNARGNPHLHFEIHPGGEGTAAIDPYDAVAFLCPGSAQA